MNWIHQQFERTQNRGRAWRRASTTAGAAAILLACGSIVRADYLISDFENGSVNGFGWLTGDSRGVQPWNPTDPTAGPANGTVITATSGPLSGSKVLELTGTTSFNLGQTGAAALGLDIPRAAFFANDRLEFDWYPVPNGGDAGYSQLYNIVINSDANGWNAAGGYGGGDPNANQFYFTGYTGNLHHLVVDYSGIKSAILSSGKPDGGGWLQLAIQPNAGGGAPADMYFDNFALTLAPIIWNVDADGNWSNGGNWSTSAAPNSAGINASFGTIITSARTVTVDSPQTVGQVTFDNTNKYTIAGTSTLTLDNSSGGVAIVVNSGSHDITAPLVLAKDATITVTPAAGTLTLSNLQPSTVGITKAGTGKLTVNNIRAGSLTVNAGTTAILAGRSTAHTSNVQTLTIASGATMDLADNDLIVDYTGTTSPLNTIRGAIVSGYNGGSWTGTGLTSSAAAAASSAAHKTALGYAESSAVLGPTGGSFSGQTVDGTAVLVRYTYSGDANLDGKVDTLDFNNLAANFGGSGKVWSQADFNYDGVVDTLDFNNLAANFGQQLAGDASLSAALVPEPSVAILSIAASALLMPYRSLTRQRRSTGARGRGLRCGEGPACGA